LNQGEYAIFGSGPLAVRGWRENDDIDLAMTESVWHKLAQTYPPLSDIEIKIGHISAFRHWRPWFEDSRELIGTAEIIDGLPFVTLANVKKWKAAMGREKDLADIAIIDQRL
jgi:hypothetical protein